MALVLLANVGTSDLAIDVDRLRVLPTGVAEFTPLGGRHMTVLPSALAEALGVPADAPRSMFGCRGLAAHVLRRFAHADAENVRRALRLPLLVPAVHHLLDDQGIPDAILLFPTDQEPPHYEDTLDVARVAAQWLPVLANLPVLAGRVEIVPMRHDVMRDEEETHRVFEQACRDLDARFPSDTVPLTIAAMISGGVPAANRVLQRTVLDYVGPEAVLLGVELPGEAQRRAGYPGPVVPVSTWPERLRSLLRICRPLLEQVQEYGAARIAIEQETSAREREKPALRTLLALLAYAERRFNGDWEGAGRLQRDAGLADGASVLDDPWSRVRLDDLCAAVVTCHARGDLVGFLARAQSVRELAWRHLVRARSGLAIDGDEIGADTIQQHPWLRTVDKPARDPIAQRTGRLAPGAPLRLLGPADYDALVSGAPRIPQREWLERMAPLRQALQETLDVQRLRNTVLHGLRWPEGADLGGAAAELLANVRLVAERAAGLANPVPAALAAGRLPALGDLARLAMERLAGLGRP